MENLGMRISKILLILLLLLPIFPITGDDQKETDLEKAARKVNRLKQLSPTPLTTRELDDISTLLIRARNKSSEEIHSLQQKLEDLQRNGDPYSGLVDRAFFKLADDPVAQAMILDQVIQIAESTAYVSARASALTILAMNGESAETYTTRIAALTGPGEPFQVRLTAIYALGDVNPSSAATADCLRRIFSDNSASPEFQVLLRAAILAAGKGGRANVDLADDIISAASNRSSEKIIRTTAWSLARIGGSPDKSISYLHSQISNERVSRSVTEAIAELAPLAANCDTLQILNNASSNARMAGTYPNVLPLFDSGISKLEAICPLSNWAIVNQIKILKNWFLALSFLQRLAASGFAGSFIYLLFIAATFIFRPHLLASKAYTIASDSSAPANSAMAALTLPTWIRNALEVGVAIIFSFLSIRRFIIVKLGFTERATKSWTKKNFDTLFNRSFKDRTNVLQRSRYVDLEGTERHQRMSRAKVEIWIAGPGGSGKSTFAFAFARRTVEKSGNSCIPVLIDDEWNDSILKYIGYYFRLSQEHPELPEPVIRKMIRGGLVIPIFDGISERNLAGLKPKEFISKVVQDLSPKKILVTSREDDATRECHLVQLNPISGQEIALFSRDLISECSLDNFLDQVINLSGGQPISAFFVEIAAKRFNMGRNIPSSFPELISSYVQSIDIGDNMTAGDLMIAAQAAAYICIDRVSHLPRAIDRVEFDGNLNGLMDNSVKFETPRTSAQVLHQLTRTGLMKSEILLGRERWSFFNDPFCEYLAATYIRDCSTWYRDDSCLNPALKEAVLQVRKVARKANLESSDHSSTKRPPSTFD